ncbi:hypothetical protein [Cupriavidus sp. Agwp_2]|uniref:hypothetical protein n=1 Tax=Cupriavidus sp. Agwp_2 TaxID=2897324 RepID=UPI00345FAAA8
MTPEREEWLLDAMMFAGRVARCTVEPFDTTAFGGKTASRVTLEIIRDAAIDGDFPCSLSATFVFPTAGKTIEQIQDEAFERAQKMLRHTGPDRDKAPA